MCMYIPTYTFFIRNEATVPGMRKDNPEVVVFDGDLTRALKNLNRRFQASGISRILKMRRKNPGRSAWLRAKRQRSIERLKAKGVIK